MFSFWHFELKVVVVQTSGRNQRLGNPHNCSEKRNQDWRLALYSLLHQSLGIGTFSGRKHRNREGILYFTARDRGLWVHSSRTKGLTWKLTCVAAPVQVLVDLPVFFTRVLGSGNERQEGEKLKIIKYLFEPDNFTCADPFVMSVIILYLFLLQFYFCVCARAHMHGTAHIWSENLHSCKIKSIKPKTLSKFCVID